MTTGSLTAEYERLVVKIGSALLTTEAGELALDWLEALAADLARLRAEGRELIVVSSGAVALGSAPLGLPPRRSRLEEQQAAAAVGQIRLAHAWQSVMAAHGIKVAQILLTPDDTEDRRRHLNARGTLETLLGLGAMPVINENDTVATDELRYGDNDRLAARVAQMISADALLLLSDIDGLYTADPTIRPDAEHVPEVTQITPRIEAMAGTGVSRVGSGGMRTKLAAARIAVAAGCDMVIADGRLRSPIRALEGGARSTLFRAGASPGAARKRWIAGTLEVRGRLTLDAGAVAALSRGASLLPVGVTSVEGEFVRGDTVGLTGPDDRELGRGLVAYGSGDARRIIGKRSTDIDRLLGYAGRGVMVHRDDLVLFPPGGEGRKDEATG
ncbi:MAG: glutamate 5-kinase [Gammaproteobacteria bacterium]